MLYCKESDIPYVLSLDEYQRLARQSDQQKRKGSEGLRIPLLGLSEKWAAFLPYQSEQIENIRPIVRIESR